MTLEKPSDAPDTIFKDAVLFNLLEAFLDKCRNPDKNSTFASIVHLALKQIQTEINQPLDDYVGDKTKKFELLSILRLIFIYHHYLRDLDPKRIIAAIPILTRIKKAISPHFLAYKFVFLKDIADTNIDLSQLELKLNKYEQVLEIKGIPDILKNFLLFNCVFTKDRLNELISNSPHCSPVLQQANDYQRRAIFWHDILRTAIDSGSIEVLSFLKIVASRQSIIDRYDKGVNLHPQEQSKIDHLIDSLSGISGFTRFKGNKIYERKLTWNEIKKVLNCNGTNFSSQIIKLFAQPLGCQSLEEVIDRMKANVSEAQERNTREFQPQFKVSKGDLIKSVGSQNFPSILQNGVYANEFRGNGNIEKTDKTPLDTDFYLSDGTNTTSLTKLTNLLSQYGDTFLVFNSGGNVHLTSSDQSPDLKVNIKQEAKRYELFSTPMISSKYHYGIRTAYPCTRIKAVITQPTCSPSEIELMKIAIANKGFFIPIYDTSGTCIFTPQEYESLKSMSRLELPTFEKGASLTKIFSTINRVLGQFYKQDAGVKEGYSLGQHTYMVMRQFEKYFSHNPLPLGFTREQFLIFLAVHDLGKPLSVQRSIKDRQAQYNLLMAKSIINTIEKVGTSAKKAMLLLLQEDVLGSYMQDKTKSNETALRIKQMAATCLLDPFEFYEFCLIYYVCDASSYTTDAIGKDSLNHLFSFDKGSLKFSAKYSAKINVLVDNIKGKL